MVSSRRQSLISTLDVEGFVKHPLAPCVALMYEPEPTPGARAESAEHSLKAPRQQRITGLIVIETDDLLGGGIGDKFHTAVKNLRKRSNIGR